MSSQKTEHYELNQWLATDQVLRTDFNADNAKIDAALNTLDSGKADTTDLDALSATVAGHTAQLDQKGNCRIYVHTYTGNGQYGSQNPCSFTFPAQPVLVFLIELARVPGDQYNPGGQTMWTAWGAAQVYSRAGGEVAIPVTWSGNTMSWYYTDAASQYNYSGGQYMLVALLTAGE